jgi:glyoxylase-like metal-dependent hydrolase (beta-lactamase superfamily II)
VIAADGGVVLFDTGVGGPGRLRLFELALAGAGFGIEDVRLVVCTHAHTDHFGLAGPIAEAAGCEYWIHPWWDHLDLNSDDGPGRWVEGARAPDRALEPGTVVDTDLGSWVAHPTPGHAPSHMVFHQPERRLLISGDHLLGRTILSYERGPTTDPVGEYLVGLDLIETLEVELCLSGHGRTFRDPAVKIAEARRQIATLLELIESMLAERPHAAAEIMSGLEESKPDVPRAGIEMPNVQAYLDRLVALGRAEVRAAGPSVSYTA